MKKKAFTFAELMISLVIVSVVAALLYPAITKYSPNTNKPLFQAAYRTLATAVGEIANTSNVNSIGGVANNAHGLCINFCNKVNIVPEGNVDDTCNTLCSDNEITTTNGMRWRFDQPAGGNFRVSVDVNASNNNLNSANQDNRVFNFQTNGQSLGVFSFTDANIISFDAGGNRIVNKENLKAQDSFWIDINPRGKVIDMSPAGWEDLEDSTNNLD